jgi:hypothetical protein
VRGPLMPRGYSGALSGFLVGVEAFRGDPPGQPVDHLAGPAVALEFAVVRPAEQRVVAEVGGAAVAPGDDGAVGGLHDQRERGLPGQVQGGADAQPLPDAGLDQAAAGLVLVRGSWSGSPRCRGLPG